MKKLIGKNIKYLKSKKKMSSRELAKEINKTPSTITDYEKGKSLAPIDILYIFTQLFNVTLDEIATKDIEHQDKLDYIQQARKMKKQTHVLEESKESYGKEPPNEKEILRPLEKKLEEMDNMIAYLKQEMQKMKDRQAKMEEKLTRKE